MTPENREIVFSPGQFAYLSVDCTQGCGVSHEFHPYTLDSDPLDRKVSVAVKALGDDSARLLHVRPGNKATLEGPYGNLFKKVGPTEAQLWIAGGIGITPFISLLRHWRKTPDAGKNIYLVLLLKKSEENIFAAEYANLQGLSAVVHVDERDGPPDLKDLLPQDWSDRNIVISGATEMVRAFKRDLYKMGARKIRTEEFDF
jgi:predicted ferric reductase